MFFDKLQFVRQIEGSLEIFRSVGGWMIKIYQSQSTENIYVSTSHLAGCNFVFYG
jgi:hypothetical protein